MKKHIANIITGSRIVFSVPLMFLPLSMTFVETTYRVATVCVLATVAVMQEVYLIVNGQEVV